MPDLFDAVQVGANPTSVQAPIMRLAPYRAPHYEPEQDISGTDYDRATVAYLARRALNPPMGPPYEPPYEPEQDISEVQAPIMRLAPYRAPHYEPEQDISEVQAPIMRLPLYRAHLYEPEQDISEVDYDRTLPDITGSDLLDAVRTAAGLSNPVGALLLYNYINGLRGE